MTAPAPAHVDDERSVVALTAGMRTPSSTRALSDALTAAVLARLGQRGLPAAATTVEVRDVAVDAARALVEGGRSAPLAEALRAVEAADVLVVVSPVYNGSYTGLFKCFVDLLDPAALLGTPVVLAATGGSMRHSLVPDHELRPLFAFFQSAATATAVYATSKDWEAPGRPAPSLAARIDRAAAEAAALVTSSPA